MTHDIPGAIVAQVCGGLCGDILRKFHVLFARLCVLLLLVHTSLKRRVTVARDRYFHVSGCHGISHLVALPLFCSA